MIVIDVPDVNSAFVQGLRTLALHGVREDSEKGTVIRLRDPVTTVYRDPVACVLWDEKRDANPFLHLTEAVWMLAGFCDVEPLAEFASNMRSYAEDDGTLLGAYGWRWCWHWEKDQLLEVVHLLKARPTTRQAVLQMWDPDFDLGRVGKDLPCNLTVVFSPYNHTLNMTVFCRSNDAIWGAYGANAVHFSYLLQFVADQAGFDVGSYTQVSVNFHAYEAVFDRCYPSSLTPACVAHAGPLRFPFRRSPGAQVPLFGEVRAVLAAWVAGSLLPESIASLSILRTAEAMREAFRLHRREKRTGEAIAMLTAVPAPDQNDWITAGILWLQRRLQKQAQKEST